MAEHPDTYTMNRDEWLEVNRVLAGASLALSLPNSNAAVGKRADRLRGVRAAQAIMSGVYDRAALTDTGEGR